jgi:hypothetical protein
VWVRSLVGGSTWLFFPSLDNYPFSLRGEAIILTTAFARMRNLCILHA